MHLIIVIIIITLFKSQGYLAEHKCSTNWEDYKSTEIRRKQSKCWFSRRGEPRGNSTRMWRLFRESISGHIGGRRVLSPLRQPCSPVVIFGGSILINKPGSGYECISRTFVKQLYILVVYSYLELPESCLASETKCFVVVRKI